MSGYSFADMPSTRGWPLDGLSFRGQLTVKSRRGADDIIEVLSPSVGYFRDAPAPGTVLSAASVVGSLETLGVLHRLLLDNTTQGMVTGEPSRRRDARLPMDYGAVLFRIDPSASPLAAQSEVVEGGDEQQGLVFRAPSSGRFYSRPAPDQPPFVTAGDIVQEGSTLALLEIMKTFHRVTYSGADLPIRARVLRVIPQDGADLEVGDPIIELEEDS